MFKPRADDVSFSCADDVLDEYLIGRNRSERPPINEQDMIIEDEYVRKISFITHHGSLQQGKVSEKYFWGKQNALVFL